MLGKSRMTPGQRHGTLPGLGLGLWLGLGFRVSVSVRVTCVGLTLTLTLTLTLMLTLTISLTSRFPLFALQSHLTCHNHTLHIHGVTSPHIPTHARITRVLEQL